MARARGSGLWYTPGAHKGIVVFAQNNHIFIQAQHKTLIQLALRRAGLPAITRVKCEKYSAATRVQLRALAAALEEKMGNAICKNVTHIRERKNPIAQQFVRSGECARHFARGWPPVEGTCAAGCTIDGERMLRCAAGG